jgi:hypothetical protein
MRNAVQLFSYQIRIKFRQVKFDADFFLLVYMIGRLVIDTSFSSYTQANADLPHIAQVFVGALLIIL